MNVSFKYVRGYLRIRVWGYSPERFMNLCSNHQIVLWDICRCDDSYTMFISLSDFYRLKPIVKKTGTRAAVVERYGLPFFIQRLRKRKIFAMGLPVCLIFLVAMSQFVWAIDFEGNYSVTDDVLMDFLVENGVDYGTMKRNIDIEQLEAGLRSTFDVITWTSVKLEGTRFVVKIKENDLAEDEVIQEPDDAPGSDLIATKDGTVVSIITRQGVPLVQSGSEVHAGDVLVSGAVPVLQDDGTVLSYQYCHADADVILSYHYPVSETQPLVYRYRNYTDRQKKNLYLGVGHKRWVFRMGDCKFLKCDTVVESHQLHVMDQVYLPFYYGFVVHREYLPVESIYDKDKAESLLNEKLSKIIESLQEKGVQILQKDVKIETAGETMSLTGDLQVQGQNGEPKALEEVRPEPETADPGNGQ